MGKPVAVRMVDREKVLVVLRKRFPSARSEDIAATANAIVGLDPEYEGAAVLSGGDSAHSFPAQ